MCKAVLVWYIGECMRSTSRMVSKNLSMGIKIVTLVKYWYLVDMSRWENLLYTRVVIIDHSKPYSYQRRLYLGMKVLAWYIDRIVSKTNYHQIPIPYWFEICQILIIDTLMVPNKDDTRPAHMQSHSMLSTCSESVPSGSGDFELL